MIDRQFHGATSRYELDVDGQDLCMVLANNIAHADYQAGENITVNFPRAAVHILESAQ
jgi:hypothetical protein